MAAIIPSINAAALTGIKDPNTRDVLRQIVSGWQVRNGQSGTGDQAFLTADDLKDAVKKRPIVDAIADALATAPRRKGGAYTPVGALITELQARVLSDPFFMSLGERIKLLDAPDVGLVDKMIGVTDGLYTLDQTINNPTSGLFSQLKGIGLRVGNATTGYASLTQLKADAVSASATYTDQVAVALGASVSAGDSTERNYRVQSDNAMVSAINTLWATVGDGTAIVQSGTNTVANRTGAAASAWQQVQAAIRDPVTGNVVSSVAIKTTLDATANAVTGLSAKYTVKLDAGGYVVGYGLASEVDTTGRRSSRFYIRADNFAIGGPSSVVDAVTGESATASVPFIVTTTTTTVNGRTAPPGVYIDRAFIRNGSIDNLAVGYAAIETANIRDLAVDTLKIKDNAVTIPSYLNGAGGSNHLAGQAMQRVGYITVTYDYAVSIVGILAWQCECGSTSTNTRAEIRVPGVGNIMAQTNSLLGGFTSSCAGSGRISLPAGTYLIEIWMGNDWYQSRYYLRQWSCTLLGVMK